MKIKTLKNIIFFILLLLGINLNAQDKLTAEIGFDTYADDELDDIGEDLTGNLRELLIKEYEILVPDELVERNFREFKNKIISYEGKATIFITYVSHPTQRKK